jgi:hypothetical protein
MTTKIDATVTDVLAPLMAELGILKRDKPLEMERVAALIGNEDSRAAVTDLMLSIMPNSIDGEQWIAWLHGGLPPTPRTLRNPDGGARPHARGRMGSAAGRRDAAEIKLDRLKSQLDEAQSELDAAIADVHRAEEQVRIVVVYTLMAEMSRQASALALGPLYAVARAVSPYLQKDPAFEASLKADETELLVERRLTRTRDSLEIFDRLDRYAGDERLELKLHRAILKVVRDIHQEYEDQKNAARKAGKPIPLNVKRRSVRRTTEAQNLAPHPAARREDAEEVFSALSVDAKNPAPNDID